MSASLLYSYFVCLRKGDFIPRHMKVFKNNEFFAGLSIPEPDVRESLEAKMPRDFSADGMDFLKVCLIRYCSSKKSISYRLMLTD